MKRRILSLLLVLALCLSMLPAASAAKISDDEAICKAFHELYPRTELSSIHVGLDYGTFSGWRVVVMACDEWAETADRHEFEIAGYPFIFTFSAWSRFLAYRDGEFIQVKDAYDEGLLQKEDIAVIYYEKRAAMTDPNWSSKEMADGTAEICAAYAERNPDAEIERIYVERDYGTYNGWRVVVMACDVWADPGDFGYWKIAGFTFPFSFSEWDNFLAYRDGEFIQVREAYEAGFLTADDIGHLCIKHTGSAYSGICKALAARYPDIPVEDVYVECDYGVFNGWQIVKMSYLGAVGTADILYLNIADYIFTFSSGFYHDFFLAYRDGELHTVEEACNKGLLREEDIGVLYDHFGASPKCAKAITGEELLDVYREYVLRYGERVELKPEEVKLQKDFGLLDCSFFGSTFHSDRGPYRVVWLSRSDGRNHTAENGLSFRDGDDLYWVPDTGSGEELLLAYIDGSFVPLDEILSPDKMPVLTKQEKADFFRSFWEQMGTPFWDVPEDAWCYDEVSYAYANKLMNGVSDELFAPNNTMTRAMLVTVLWRANGSPTGFENKFTDVPSGKWYTDAVAWAEAGGIVNGVGGGKFAPNSPITREQFVTILYRLSGSPDTAPGLGTEYLDTDKISKWAYPAMRWAVDNGILEGTEDASRKGFYHLNPGANATRAQAAAILMRYQNCNVVPMATDLTAGLTAAGLPVEPKVSEEAADAIADFSVDVFKKAMSGEENTVLSPLSLLYALSMLANGAEENTRAELEAAFGMSVDEMNGALYNLRAILPGFRANVNLANSIWIRDTFADKVKPEFLQADMDYYDAAVFAAPFEQATVNDINGWVSRNTHGMIPKLIDSLSDETVMALVNALLFECSWENKYSTTFTEPFYAYDGSTKIVDMLKSCENVYLEDENAIGFRKTLDGHYDFAVIVPKEGVDLKDYVASLDGQALRKLLEGSYADEVHATMPEFTSETFTSLTDVLNSMGVKDVFSPVEADLSGISDDQLYVSEVLQRAKIDVYEQGVSAAAATAIVVERGAPAPSEEPIIKYVTADRPYLYMLIDTTTRLPLFIGTNLSIHSVKEEIAGIRAGVEEVKREAFLQYIAALDPSEYSPNDVLVEVKDTPEVRKMKFSDQKNADSDSFKELLGIDFAIGGAHLLGESAVLEDGVYRLPEESTHSFVLKLDGISVVDAIRKLVDAPLIESVSPNLRVHFAG